MYGSVGTHKRFANNRGGDIIVAMIVLGEGFQDGRHRGDLHTGKLTGIVAYKVVGAEGAEEAAGMSLTGGANVREVLCAMLARVQYFLRGTGPPGGYPRNLNKYADTNRELIGIPGNSSYGMALLG